MCILKKIIFSLLILSSTLTHAEDLLDIYRLAEMNDAVIQTAKETQLAAREVAPQARAQFMPVIQATASHAATDINYGSTTVSDPLTLASFPPDLAYNQSIYSLSLNQPVFYYQQWVQLAKASEQVKQANATYAAAEQDLVVRTIRGYFNVLRAIDNLKFSKAATLAFDKFLEQTTQRFKVGLIAITDVEIARAQRDNAYAQEIAAANELENQKELLRIITGRKIDVYAYLKDNVTLRPPEPANMEKWVLQALEQNFTLLSARFQVQASKIDIKLNQANHLPTLNINGGITSSTVIPTTPKNTNRNIGLQVTLPIFNGGAVTSKTRQAVHTYEQIYYQMETTYRKTESDTRQAYRGVLTQISQVAALNQAVVSNNSALKATDAAFKVGTRTIVDVLNAQSNLIQAEKDRANARYDYIIQSTLLKQAAGILNPQDIRHINCWLTSI